MIREALDLAIPRANIINNSLNGFGIVPLSPIIAQLGIPFYKESNLRTYNLSLASDLLTQVFGYRYNALVDNLTTPFSEQLPYFIINLIVPTNNALRLSWVNQIVSNWEQIGISVLVQYLGLNQILARIINNPAGFGWDYDHGGFDAILLEWFDIHNDDVYNLLNSASTVPASDNYYFLNNSLMDTYTNIIEFSNNQTARNLAFQNVQQWYYENIPSSIIYQRILPYAMNQNLSGFNAFNPFDLENWTFNGKSHVTISVPYTLANLNPIFYNYFSMFDNYIIKSSFKGMFVVSTENSNFTNTQNNLYPYFADWWNSSIDGLSWFANLKSGLKWSDGVELNATDVKFTFDVNLNQSSGSVYYPYINNIINNVQIINSTLIKFEFNRYYPYALQNILTIPILPEHILQKINPSNLVSDITNSQGIGAYNGPYTLVSTNQTLAQLTINPVYTKSYVQKLNYSSILGANSTGIPGLAVPTIENITIAYIPSASSALSQLQQGNIDFIDAQTNLVFNYVFPYTNDTLVNSLENAWQETGYNQGSPIWGINPINPSLSYPSNQISLYTTTSSFSYQTSYTTSSIFFNGIQNFDPTLIVLGVLLIISLVFMAITINNRKIKQNKTYVPKFTNQTLNGLQTKNQIFNNKLGKFCWHCGHPVDNSDIFCQDCGTKL